MMLAGRLDGHVDRRPIFVVANGCDITIDAGSLPALIMLRKSLQSVARLLLTAFVAVKVRLLLKARWFGTIELFPNPSPIVRLSLTLIGFKEAPR